MSTIIPDSTHITEFVGGFHGTCGETALSVAMGASRGFPVTPDFIVNMTNTLIAQGAVGANGSSTMPALSKYAKDQGYSVLYEYDYQGDNWDEATWHQQLIDHAGIHPIVLNIARGGNLTDVETGSHAETGVQYHVIAVVGKQIDGYICADGDNWEVGTRFQVYPLDTIRAALPCGMLILDMQRDKPMVYTFPVVRGFADFLQANPATAAFLGDSLAPESQVPDVGDDGVHGPGSRQPFNCGVLAWIEKTNVVVVLWVGLMWMRSQDQIQTQQGQITDLQRQLANNMATIAALRQQVNTAAPADPTAETLRMAWKAFMHL